jgi:hypothetical protein
MIGAFILAVEWALSNSSNSNYTDINSNSIPKKKGVTERVVHIEELVARLQSSKLRFSDLRTHSVADLLPTRKLIYVRGFLVIIFGIVLQITANSIGWAGAYGLFS